MAASDKNNLLKKIQREFSKASTVPTGRNEAELEKFSVASNVRTEKAWPTPNYSTFKRAAVASADADPTATPPDDAKLWDLQGYSGLHGYATFDGGTSPTVELELWAKDEENNQFFLVDGATVSANTEFRFAEAARSRKCFVRVAGLTGSPTSASLYCSAE